jgi:predicted secreted protein
MTVSYIFCLSYMQLCMGTVLNFYSRENMKNTIKLIAATAMFAGASTAFTQNIQPLALHNVVQLSASGSVDVQQDLLVLTLSSARDGKDAAVVQSQLRQALDAAVLEARRNAEPGQMEVRTGNFSLYPRYSQNSQINGWQGNTELVLQGRDFARITSTAARITSMAIAQVAFSLSAQQRSKVERDAQTLAIENFKTQAADLTRAFGFADYTLREVSVNSNSYAPGPRPRMAALEAKSAMVSDAPIAVEAGKSTVTVNVSGSVQMR